MRVGRYILSKFYQLGIFVRNLLYDEHILRSVTPDITTIVVGNVAVGGTGKTPHVEYLVDLLQDKYKIAVLSRGYKRKSRGFVLADATVTARDIGDEPMQIHLKYPDLILAVSENRVHGIERLRELYPDLQVVLLDDAFQYRHLKSKMNILLTTADNLFVKDTYLPHGKLRDLRSQSLRANIVIVTKCTSAMRPIDRRIIETSLHLPQYQQLYFSSYSYGELIPVFADYAEPVPARSRDFPLVLTGIENPQPMFDYIQAQYPQAQLLAFPDHYTYTKKDMEKILSSPYIITTEKDAARLRSLEYYPEELKSRTFALPIKAVISEQEQFNNQIIQYVREDNRNR